MIAVERIVIAEQLIREGKLSQRQIAKQTGLSRATIGAVAAGKRRIYERKKPEIEHDTQAPYVRCPECGHLVRLPCVRCFLQKRRKKKSLVSDTPVSGDEFNVNPSGAEAERYEEVKKWRRQHSNPHFTDIPDN